jgi:hypothetical protein
MNALLLLAAVLSIPDSRPQTSRPLMDTRHVIAVAPQGAGFDAYWARENEPRGVYTLWRTRFAADGSRVSTSLVMTDAYVSVGVPGGDAPPLVLFREDLRALRASAIVDGVLADPEGKLIEPYADYPFLACGGGRCAAVWYDSSALGSTYKAAWLAPDGTRASATFSFGSYTLYSMAASGHGLHVVRRAGNDIRATHFRTDGSIAYDVTLFQSDPLAFAEPIVSAVFDGTSHVIAYGQRPPGNLLQPDSVKMLTISPSGAHEPARAIVEVARPDQISWMRLAWNGTEHLLAWSAAGGPFLQRLSPALLPIDISPRVLPAGIQHPLIVALPDGRFVIEANRENPSLMLLRRDGQLTEPVAVDPGTRRRTSRK